MIRARVSRLFQEKGILDFFHLTLFTLLPSSPTFVPCPLPVGEASCETLRGKIGYKSILPFLTLLSTNYHTRIQDDPPDGIMASPTPDNIMTWHAVIFGPEDTPFEDGTFKLALTFDENYPNKPPVVRFVSKMFHPNVYADGGICLDILQNRYSNPKHPYSISSPSFDLSF